MYSLIFSIPCIQLSDFHVPQIPLSTILPHVPALTTNAELLNNHLNIYYSGVQLAQSGYLQKEIGLLLLGQREML